jgi:hypothetical protein
LSKEIIQPIFVVGMPRSGTTIISEVLSAHEDLGWFPNYFEKLPFIPQVSVLTRILNIPKIGWYLRGKKKQGSSLSSYIRRILPHCSEAFSVWARHCGQKFLWEYMIDQIASEKEKNSISTTIAKVLFFQGKKRFFAKLTGPPRMNYLNSIFPDAFFINVIRDPRATVSSLLRVPFWKNAGGHDKEWWRNGLGRESIQQWIDSGKSPIVLSSLQWKQVVEVAWHEKENIDEDRYMEIHYEEFVRDPFKVTEDIADGVNLSRSRSMRRYINSIGTVKNMNHKFTKNLSPSDIRLIEKITFQTATRAGYLS